jgi:alkaline phosphatase D
MSARRREAPQVLKRRDFLKLTGTFFATASLAGVPGCGDNDGGGPDAGAQPGVFRFAEGVASGDPRTDRVVLWTRCVATDAAATGPIDLIVEVSASETFDTVVVSRPVQATSASDFTVRVVVDGLAANTWYYYRFVAGADEIEGRTRTAPAADADVPVHFAWASCQDYAAGFFGAYKQMIADDAARPEAERIQFIVHLGDFIYESNGETYHAPLDDDFVPISITNADGTPRTVGDFPSGGGELPAGRFAQNLDDYRFLYKRFLSDPDLRAARARWPFIQTWDDHEFTNDAWQTQANYTNDGTVNESSQPRKVAANQAWFEYVPALLTGIDGVAGVTQDARDFAPATVQVAEFTAPNAETNFVDEPNNVAAVGSLTIYRSLRWGKHVDLVITDQRSYRSDHAIPEELANTDRFFFDPRNAVHKVVVDVLDAGRTANGGNPPDEIPFGPGAFPNVRKASPPGTMLGAAQKEWFKATLKGSTATWKIWGNEVPLLQVVIKDPLVQIDRVMSGDAWDGYPSERRELMTYVADEDIKNLLVITGDVHAQFAGQIAADYDAATKEVVAAELVTAGIASNSLFSFFEEAARAFPGPLQQIISFDASASGGPRFVENMNMLVLHGQASALHAAGGGTVAAAIERRVDTNDLVKYADTNAQGYGLLSITADQAVGTLVTINRPVTNPATAPGIKRTATFTIPKDNPAGMTGPVITGTRPYPLS